MIQVFIALLLFAFFAFGGLIADLGFVRLTQRQMSNAADGVALEALRLEDSLSDADRRQAARKRMQDFFDDDFRATFGDDYNYGAGPSVSLLGGSTNMGANKRLVIDSSVVYEPDVQLNATNEDFGDLVAGWYDETDPDHAEDPTYQRTDFDTSSDPSRREAFLVRIRRTNNTGGLDAQAGISSTGPVVPYLFARGSLMAGETREEGVSVRATTIAQARNATLAGPPHDEYGIPGYAPIALELDYWNSIPDNGTFVLQFGGRNRRRGNPNPGGRPLPNPNPTRGAPPIIPPGQLVGGGSTPNAVFADRLDDAQRRSWSIGDPVYVDTAPDIDRALALMGNPHLPGFTPRLFVVPLYEGDVLLFYDGRPGNSNPPFLPPVNNVPKDDMDPRIVGFASFELLRAEINPGDDGDDDEDDDGQDHIQLFIRKLPATIFPTNLSAVAAPGLADLPRWLTDQLADLNATIDEPAKAAALGR